MYIYNLCFSVVNNSSESFSREVKFSIIWSQKCKCSLSTLFMKYTFLTFLSRVRCRRTLSKNVFVILIKGSVITHHVDICLYSLNISVVNPL